MLCATGSLGRPGFGRAVRGGMTSGTRLLPDDAVRRRSHVGSAQGGLKDAVR